MKEVKLSPRVVEVLQDLRNQTKEPQEKIANLNQQFQNIIVTLCLQEDLDFETQDIKLSDDLLTLIVEDKIQPENTKPAKPTKVRKM